MVNKKIESNGKIYKIEPISGGDEGDIYIGSTTKQYLSQRMDKHRSGYKYWKTKGTYKITSYNLFEKYGVDNCQIVLLESCSCNSKDELLAKEKHYIKQLCCVNKGLPQRTQEETREYHTEYNNSHIEHIREVKRIYTEERKEFYTEFQKQYYQDNKDKIKQRRNEKIVCECGTICIRARKSIHIKTQKHTDFIIAKIIST